MNIFTTGLFSPHYGISISLYTLTALWHIHCTIFFCRSYWPRSLRCRSAATRLLEFRIRIPSGHECLSLLIVMCCQVEVSASGWSPVPMSPTEYGVRVWCPSVVSEYGVRVWCPSVVSECGVRVWCPSMVSEYGVRVWCPSVVSEYGVRVWS